MIPSGTIRKVGQYYRNNPEYKEEVLRGLREFFVEGIGDSDNPLFNEWMMYDFKFSDGQTMLNKFYVENPLSIPLYRREIYKTLQENYFGFFEVLEVRRFQGLSLRRLNDKKTFEVFEVSATMELEAGDVFITRVAMVIDHYELVGSDTQVIPISRSKSVLERKKSYKLLSTIDMITPQDALKFWSAWF